MDRSVFSHRQGESDGSHEMQDFFTCNGRVCSEHAAPFTRNGRESNGDFSTSPTALSTHQHTAKLFPRSIPFTLKSQAELFHAENSSSASSGQH